jgi:hypothetical protein
MHRTVLFVAPEFPPCNLTAGHRTRLFVRHLPEFGYRPVVLTLRPESYETKIDPELMNLVAPGAEIVRTRALPVRPVRPVRLIGDLGIRSFPFHLAAVRKLVRTHGVDLIYIPIPPNYSSLLGPLSRFLFRVPFAIDYIDPWIYRPTADEWRSPKSLASHALSRLLEPLALCGVAGITGVAEGYYAGALDRHPRLRNLPLAAIPYGGEAMDFQYVRDHLRPSRLLAQPELSGKLVLTYGGAILPRAHGTLRSLLLSCARWKQSGDPLAERVALLFVGTGRRPTDPGSGVVAPIARECGADHFVTEIADRQPFIDVLSLLTQSHAVMVLGSSDPYYTASKTFQALQSRRPILALLHAASSAAGILNGLPGVAQIRFDDTRPVEGCHADIVQALRQMASASSEPVDRDMATLDEYSARAMTRRLAAFFDDVLRTRIRS